MGRTGVAAIGDRAFSGTGIKQLGLSSNENLVSIGEEVFANCPSLKHVTFPLNVKIIPAKALFQCESLRSVGVPLVLESIGESAFVGCKKLFNINIPPNITDIADDAFLGCPITLYVAKGSYAENYAVKNNYRYDEHNEYVKFVDCNWGK